MKSALLAASIALLCTAARVAEPEPGARQFGTLPDHSSATEPAPELVSTTGSFVVWIRPQWPDEDRSSHTIFSLRWQGDEQSYMALSQGWWEPTGQATLYFVLSNQDFVFCNVPDEFRYQIFTRGKWTNVAATWTQANKGRLRLYVDGLKVCERVISVHTRRVPKDVLYLGSDLGATDNRQRGADFQMRDLQFYPIELSATTIARQYTSGGGESYRKWMRAIVGEGPASPGPTEPRIMFDEDAHWVKSRAEIDRAIALMVRAGINTYVPCVWDGGQALFATNSAPVDPRYQSQLASGYDPLAYLISAAQRAGIAVVLWFEVVRRPGGSWPATFVDGAPPDAFNAHSPAFAEFVTQLIAEASKRYRPDGVNLDYIRSMGVCSSPGCAADYRARYRRDLRADWLAQERGIAVPTLMQWNARAIGAIVESVSTRLRKAEPKLLLSVSTIPFDPARRHQGVDITDWLQRRLIDFVVYMAYEEPLEIARVTSAWQKIPRGKLVVLVRNFDLIDGAAKPSSGEQVADEVKLVRRLWPGSGVGFYHFPHFSAEQAGTLGSQVFGEAVANSWQSVDCEQC